MSSTALESEQWMILSPVRDKKQLLFCKKSHSVFLISDR